MSKGTVLVIDDEPQIQKMLGIILAHADYDVVHADNGEKGLAAVAYKKPQAVLLDMGLPDMEGFDVLLRIREFSDPAVIVVSVQGQEAIKVKCLENGADDYITKPFSALELTARLSAVLRRKASSGIMEDVFDNAGLRVEFNSRGVTLNGKPLKLTSIEYNLLSLLIKNTGRVLTVRQILKEVWATDNEERANSVRVYLNHLRQKIEDNPAVPARIINEPGIGYRFNLL
ncbi:MAG: response regulator transcription factor [Candidatus Omnitrophica bacterium]|nr:response regulator transcription factor [Candidatus Omnitrophota bacterium]MDE2222058.1 response regulator transcription factor [Candidatus Omnitrophota bacterium]